MRRLCTLAGLALLVTTAACADAPAPTDPASASGPSLASSGNGAEHYLFDEVREDTFVLLGPSDCTGEAMITTFRQRVRLREVTDASGNLHGKWTVTDLGSEAIGEETGTYYRVHDANQESYSESWDEATEEWMVRTWTTSFKRTFIGQGRAPNLIVQGVAHYTYGPDGELRVEFGNLHRTCH